MHAMGRIRLEALLAGCADDASDAGIRIDTELEPLGGPGGRVKPAVYEGGRYQHDRRWASATDDEATPVIVIDNVPSQANRLESALRGDRERSGLPEFVLDLSALGELPAHLPRKISSFSFPHRNADAYLRDARLGDEPFIATPLGAAIFAATPEQCGPLAAWFPQALLFGFWQSHLGRKQHNTKHARAWVSEIVGWRPAAAEPSRVLGLKGDPLNLSVDERIVANPEALEGWEYGDDAKALEGGRRDRLSEIGHGQVPFMDPANAAAGAVSFARVTQHATVSFAQLRRLGLGPDYAPEADPALRALLVATGLHAHAVAFGRGFALRSGADLRPGPSAVTWLGATDEPCELGGPDDTGGLLSAALSHATALDVPLDGWWQPPTILTPRENLRRAIRASWPARSD